MSVLEKIDHRGDAWQLLREYANHFFREVLKQNVEHLSPSEIQDFTTRTIDKEFGVVLFKNLEKLAKITAEMHLALKKNPANLFSFCGESLKQNKPIFKEALNQSWEHLKHLPGPWQDAARSAGENTQDIKLHRLQTRLTSIIETAPELLCIRIHGDYHLGQLLWTGNDFVVIDFEGETGKLEESPRGRFPVHRDVAGMLRSFSYSTFITLANLNRENLDITQRFKPFANAWIKILSESFYSYYLLLMKGSGLVYPWEQDNRQLLDFFMIQKAIYELDYEHHNRPSWALIPTYGLEDLMERLLC